MNPLKVMKKMCSTCPWRRGSPAAYLRADLEERSLLESRICHSTGGNNVVKEAKEVSKESLICRGSRNFQLRFVAALGIISEPTDEAWTRKVQQMEARRSPPEKQLTGGPRTSAKVTATTTKSNDSRKAVKK